MIKQRARDILHRQNRAQWTKTMSPSTRRALLEALESGPSAGHLLICGVDAIVLGMCCFAAATTTILIALVLLF